MNNLNKKHNTTFETKVYENDWKYILLGDYLDTMISNCCCQFVEKVLFINNVDNIDEVIKHAQKKIDEGVLDKYYLVDEYADQALAFFDIEKDSFKGGYYYSISELVSIYLCKTEYLLHFSSDSFIKESNKDWISYAIEIFNQRTDIIVANPAWDYNYEGVKEESLFELEDFYVGYGFSDQCYLIKTEVFKSKMYNDINYLSERYPKYGGELFEKRVDSYMRNNKLLRITSKEVSYIHRNFPKKNIFYKCNYIVKFFAKKRNFNMI